MCLNIKNVKQSKPTKPIIAWKVVTKDDMGRIYSLFRDSFVWKNGLNISSRRTTKLTKDEIKWQDVYSGFHCLISRSTAIRCSKSKDVFCNCDDFVVMKVVMKVVIQPEDFVAIGTFERKQCIVATKVTATLPT